MKSIMEESVMDVIDNNYGKLFLAEKKVVDIVLQQPQEVVNMNVKELAKASGVSDATVVRMCHHIGYQGYYQFRIMLAKDLGREQIVQTEKAKDDSRISSIFKEYVEQIISIGENMDEKMVEECVDLIKSCQQAHIIAVGNTAPLAQYMGFRLGRLGVKCTFNISAEYFMNHVNLAGDEEIIIAISQSGTSKMIVEGMHLAQEKGMKSIAITAYRHSEVAELADYTLLSNSAKKSFDYYKNYAHLNETAIIDMLLELLLNQERIFEKDADKPEIIMAESKY